VHSTVVDKYAALQFELSASNDGDALKQVLALTFSRACYMSATFGANPSSYVEYLPALDGVRAGHAMMWAAAGATPAHKAYRYSRYTPME
jgi:hypothetical protein